MTDNSQKNRTLVPRSGGFFQELASRFRLIGRLMMDSRVNPFLKVLPVGTLIYVLSPIDLLSVNPLDDAFIIWAGTTLFVELCPPNVVEEHLQNLNRVDATQWKDFPNRSQKAAPAPEGEVIEGEYFETDPKTSRENTGTR